MKIDHVGYVTAQIEETVIAFQNLGYVPEPVIDFESHKCKVCFLRKEGEITVELVEPYEDNKQLRKLLKNGPTPYHLCYEVPNLRDVCLEMKKKGYIALSEPIPAPAFKGREICYMWSRALGFLEFVSCN